MKLLDRIRGPATDEFIIDLYWERDEGAISETEKKYGKYLFAVAYNILYSSEDCEECLDDTYIAAWEAIPPDRPINLRAYLTTIVRRIAINRYNEKNRKKRVPSNMTLAIEELEYILGECDSSQFDAEHLGEVISEYLKTLSKRQRYIFMSRYYAAEPVDKIAEDLALSRSSVNKELSKMREGLKNALEKEGYTV